MVDPNKWLEDSLEKYKLKSEIKDLSELDFGIQIITSIKEKLAIIYNELEKVCNKIRFDKDFESRLTILENMLEKSDTMRKIMVEHVNLDIEEDVKKIKCPTLLLWGTMDTEVPVERAYELEKLISDAGVVVYEGCSHYAYLERLQQTINILKSFIGG